ncbi:hypothetical protein RchiOBHm_Chr3g0472341 [Rosa chinensis]|uniref:Uncharacterized protein n=1 Tax=Rosa chinensis TaxID=74649 RepID=A0A2P6RBJ4_ROSCH|nr:UPF0481 protein At3g47200 [Rosa chinensis]XP_040371949.1 UPF0481 protein At3g47200 [Rosa chinensis]PRQ43805.1 hypothetical protein RchiOBHm_Chr3g0472341 [Rosa chinensis]
MHTNPVQEEHNHVTPISEMNNDRLASMYKKIADPPRLLSNAAGKDSCCIFRVPQSLLEINGKSYQPHIVSIGPFHSGQPHLRMIEEHKWRYLGSLLSRTEPKGLTLQHYLKSIEPMEDRVRECYSETIHLSSDEFIEMMVVDGCFLIELFRKFDRVVRFERDDPLINMFWVIPFMVRDFLRLENQIPYFILEHLYDLITKSEDRQDSVKSLSLLALNFFNNHMDRPKEVIAKLHNLTGKHLLDLLRSSVIPADHVEPGHKNSTPTHIIHCISKLRRAGIKLNPPKEYESFLAIKFKRGVIEMPPIIIDDFMSSFLLNCVAYEQCHKSCSKHITAYATLLDYLVNTYKDVEYLADRNIIENCFGNDEEVAHFINNLGKDVAFDDERCYLSKLFNDVHQYYSNSRHVQWASFKYTYFDTPWSFISAFAALILLIFTLLQTLYTVLSYYHS